MAGKWRTKLHSMKQDALGEIESKTAQYHTTLNPLLWGPGNTLRDDIRKDLLRIADAFESKWHVYHPAVIDIILTGSNANYNWTEFSDIDVHLVYVPGEIPAYNAYGEPQTREEYIERIANYLHDVKGMFNMLDTKVAGINVEVFPQLWDEPLKAEGIYSLRNRQWIKEPAFRPPKLNHPAIRARAEFLAKEIDTALSFGLLGMLETLNTQITKLRKSGLQKHGEFSTENMVFKVLRNAGAISQLRNAIKKAKAREVVKEEAIITFKSFLNSPII